LQFSRLPSVNLEICTSPYQQATTKVNKISYLL
jgi:hypothetical protein